MSRNTRFLLNRAIAVVLLVIVAPALTAMAAFSQDRPVRVGESSPRTVVADDTIRIVDEDATDEARRVASESVEPVMVVDGAAQTAIVAEVRALFAEVRAAAEPVPVIADLTPNPSTEGTETPTEPTTREPTDDEQVEALLAVTDLLGETGLRAIVELATTQLRTLEDETVVIAQELARQRFTESELDDTVDALLATELAVRSLPRDTADSVVRPLIRTVARPTLQVDPDATQAARQRAADNVIEVAQTWQAGEPIVTSGDLVEPLAFEALEQLGLEGSSPWQAVLRAMAAMLLTTVIMSAYLWRMQPRVWRSGRKVLLLASVVTGFAVAVAGVSLLTTPDNIGWWYIVPAGALAMLAAILVHPVVGISTMLPAVVLVLVTAPVSNGVAVWVAATVLVSVPMVTSLASRGDLRSATLRAGAAMPVIAGVTVAVFGPRDQFALAVGAGALNGLATAMLVQGLLPFLENLYRLPTVTALLDLADRNHPLLRELEQKAIGSYNHSVMVASLVERACREIGANALLGSVASLYHDIGKVRRPHFFIENQQGIVNPHDDLEPQVSASIIINHVEDGVEKAKEYRLPPEVVEAIGSHHGTMVVTYFYRKAVEAAGEHEHVDEDDFRYNGSKPRSKEAAILVIADCSEATTRSMAMTRGTLPRDEIEATVDSLLKTRLEDGQFDECDLTFDEMRRVRHSIVEALVGIYHPRIAYPAAPAEPAPATTASS